MYQNGEEAKWFQHTYICDARLSLGTSRNEIISTAAFHSYRPNLTNTTLLELLVELSHRDSFISHFSAENCHIVLCEGCHLLKLSVAGFRGDQNALTERDFYERKINFMIIECSQKT